MIVIKKNKTKEPFDLEKTMNAIKLSASRCRLFSMADTNDLTETEEELIRNDILTKIQELQEAKRKTINVNDLHKIVENSLLHRAPDVYESYSNYRNYKNDLKKEYYKLNEICNINATERNYDNANSNNLSSVAQKMLSATTLEKSRYNNFFLSVSEKEAKENGEIYIHDQGDRLLYGMNCCNFDMEMEFKNSLNVSGVIYNEPKCITSACKMLADITLAASANQYGGFTICRVDNFMAKYLENTFYKELEIQLSRAFKTLIIIADSIMFDEEKMNIKKIFDTIEKDYDFINRKILYKIVKGSEIPNVTEEKLTSIILDCIKSALDETIKLGMKGFEGVEWTLNSVFSSRGDFPFISVTFGLGSTFFEKEISKIVLKVRENGIGPSGFEQSSLFPKLIFLYDKDLHEEGCINHDVFEAAIDCSCKCQYPDYLSLTGDEKINPECCGVYKTFIDQVRIIPPNGRLADGKIVKPYKFKIYSTYKELAATENQEIMQALNKAIRESAKKNFSLISKKESLMLKNEKDPITYIFNNIRNDSGKFENIFLAAKKEVWPIPVVSSMGCRAQLGVYFCHY